MQFHLPLHDGALDSLPEEARAILHGIGVAPAARQEELICPHCEAPMFDGVEVIGHDLVGFPCCYSMKEALASYGFWEALKGADRRKAFVETCAPGAPVRRCRPEGDWTFSLGLRCEIVSKTQVREAIDKRHRHHDAPHMAILGIKCFNGNTLVGVATVSPPTARKLMEAGSHLELNRCAVWGDPFLRFNAISKISAAARRAARQLRHEARQQLTQEDASGLSDRDRRKYGRRQHASKLRTYILEEEDGHSWRAAGWEEVGVTEGGGWNRPSRPRRRRPGLEGPKTVFDTKF